MEEDPIEEEDELEEPMEEKEEEVEVELMEVEETHLLPYRIGRCLRHRDKSFSVGRNLSILQPR